MFVQSSLVCIVSSNQGRIQELARGGAQIVGGWGEQILLLVAIFFKQQGSLLSRLIFVIMAFADGCEVLKSV